MADIHLGPASNRTPPRVHINQSAGGFEVLGVCLSFEQQWSNAELDPPDPLWQTCGVPDSSDTCCEVCGQSSSMNIFIAFLPYLAFAVARRVSGPLGGMIAGVLGGAVLVLYRETVDSSGFGLFELGSLLLFACLGVYSIEVRPQWSALEIRLGVHTGLLALVLVSLLWPQASLMHRLNHSGAAHLERTTDARVNRLISGVWALVFAALVARDLLIFDVRDVPFMLDSGVPLVALALAGAATAWIRSRSPRQLVKAV